MPLVRKLLFILCLPLCLAAQQNKLIVSQPDTVIVKRGGTAIAALKIATLPGFHVNSDKPKGEFLIPLSLTWAAGPLQPGTVTYPQPETIQVGPDTLSVFTGTFEIKTAFAAPANASPGSSAMTGKLHYQACNNRMCFRPVTVDVHLPVTIE